MVPIGHPGFDDPQAAEWANFPAGARGNVGLLGGAGCQVGLPAIEEQFAQQQQIAGRVTGIVDVHAGLTEKELAAQRQPGIRSGRYQTPAVDRIATNRVRFVQAIQEYGLAQDGRCEIAVIQDVVWIDRRF